MNVVLNFLNRVTMYRLMAGFLVVLVVSAAGLSLAGVLPYSPFVVLSGAALFVLVSLAWNALFARVFRVKANLESSLITGLILSLILGPLHPVGDTLVILGASFFAIASKYFLTFRRSHIFNPAAAGALLSSLVFGSTASWWVGSMPFVPLLLIGGALVLRKMRKFRVAGVFLFSLALLFSADRLLLGTGFGEALAFAFGAAFSPVMLFFAAVMLIEPQTSPETNAKSLRYAAFVAGVFFFLFKFFPVPYLLELSLLVGNGITKIMNPDFRQIFVLRRKEKLGDSIYNFWFRPEKPFAFTAGQFLEYTLPHAGADSRGIRRYFTIASSPAEEDILLTTKFTEKGSTFKQTLLAMKEGDEISASKVSGGFVLPEETSQKLVFIAGGIGVTPFRAMVRFLLDSGEKREILLLYAARSAEELAFRKLFEEAANAGLKAVYVLSEEEKAGPEYRHGLITADLIQKEVGTISERVFYVSGPEAMVEALEKTLSSLGVPEARMKRDYFPGY